MENNKTFGKVRAIPNNVDETRTVTFLASDNTVDRHNTVLNMDGWEVNAFRANPIIGWQHNVYGDGLFTDPNPDNIIGKGDVRTEGNEMLVDITFEDGENNPLAEKIFNKVKNGILNAVSVGFREIGVGEMGDIERGQDPSVYYFKGQELLEVSVVSIPSNKNALVREFDAIKEGLRRMGYKLTDEQINGMNLKEISDLMHGRKEEKKEDNVSTTIPDTEIEYEVKKVYKVKKV